MHELQDVDVGGVVLSRHVIPDEASQLPLRGDGVPLPELEGAAVLEGGQGAPPGNLTLDQVVPRGE